MFKIDPTRFILYMRFHSFDYSFWPKDVTSDEFTVWGSESIVLTEDEYENYDYQMWKVSDLLYCKIRQFFPNKTTKSAILTRQRFFLYAIFKFFKKLQIDFNILHYLLTKKYNNLLYFLQNNLMLTRLYYMRFVKKNYFYFIKALLVQYLKVWVYFIKTKNLISPTSYLNDIDLLNSQPNKFSHYHLVHTNTMVLRKDELAPYFRSFRNYTLGAICKDTFGYRLKKNKNSFSNDKNLFVINFLRVQRRYNKRRYSKVRVYSRPSFFAGISLGSIFISCFWGGTIKSVDWIVALPVVINMNVVLLFLNVISVIYLFSNENLSINSQFFGKFKIYASFKIYALKCFFLKYFSYK